MSFGLKYGIKRRDKQGNQHSVNTMSGERYVYYERLNTDFPPDSNARKRGEALYKKANSVLKWRIDHGSNSQGISKYFGHLSDYEFAKEKALLETYFKTSYDPNSPLCGEKLIEAFNTILSTKEIFERNALLLANTNQKGVFSFFPTYLDKALEQWVGSKEFMKDIDELIEKGTIKGRTDTEKFRKAVEKNINDNTDKIIQNALERMFSENTDIENGLWKKVSKEDRERLKRAYKEVFDALKKIENTAKTNEFVRGIAQNYKISDNLGKMVADSIKGKKLNKGNVQKIVSGFKFKTTLSSKSAASLAGIDTEIFGSFLSNVTISNKGVKVDSFHTGQRNVQVNQKADMIFTIGMNDGVVKAMEEELNKFSGEGRGSNVEDMRSLIGKIFKDFGNDNSFMLIVNSKNYTPNWNFRKGYLTEGGNKIGGYSAGSAINLKTWNDMMNRLGANGKDFIFTIMQLIPGAIGGDPGNREEVADMFARTIGSALFDDFEPEDPIERKKDGPKTVHLLYLNGIYVPLSVFYTLLYQAFGDFQDSLDKNELVQVEFNLPENILYPDQADQEGVVNPWGMQSSEALSAITISYHFLSGFQKFLQQFYKINNNKPTI